MEYRNAKRLANGWIDCEINHPHYGWLPFTCNPKDDGAAFDVAELYGRMDVDPLTEPYVPPSQAEIDTQAAAEIRSERDHRLTQEVDPIASNALRWASLTDAQRQAWAEYRQALLDITAQAGFPYNVVWPTKP